MRVFLDDMRSLPDEYDTLCRTPEDALTAIMTGKVELIGFDNDLGANMEGRHVFDFLEDQVRTLQVPLPSIEIHTSNPSAGDAMEKGAKNLLRWYVVNVDHHFSGTIKRVSRW